jgi:hypothetical protein
LDLVDASQLHCLDVVDQALAVPGRDMQQSAEIADAVAGAANPVRALMERQLRDQGFLGRDFGAQSFFGPPEPGVTQQERVPWNWLKTTFPLYRVENMPVGSTDNSSTWGMRLRRELSVRTMLLRLKLATFKKIHGEYPSQLGSQRFGMDAIDPFTGTEFGYRREGFPFAFRAFRSLTYTDEIVKAGQPILWSAGPGNVRFFNPTAISNETPDQLSHPTVRPNAMTSAWVFTLP